MTEEQATAQQYRVEQMEITEFIRRKHHTFHTRGSEVGDKDFIAFELDPFGGNIYVEIVLPVGCWSWFRSNLTVKISHDGCQSSQIHCDGDTMIVTISAHNKNGCMLDHACRKYTVPLHVNCIRVLEGI